MSNPVSRTTIPFLLDLVTLSSAETIRKAEQSGQLDRVFPTNETPSTLPIPFSLLFPLSRMFSVQHGWFLPFQASTTSDYKSRLSYLHSKLSTQIDLSSYITQAVDALESNADDFTLSLPAINAFFAPFNNGKPVPEEICQLASKQVRQPLELLNPLNYIFARKISQVYSYVEQVLTDNGVLPELAKGIVTDVAHPILSLRQTGPAVLRAIYENPERSVEETMGRLALTDKVVRSVVREGTLGGVLEKPATRKTVVVLDIGAVAREGGGWEWVFSSGSGRRCEAEGLWKQFGEGVRQEILRRRES